MCNLYRLDRSSDEVAAFFRAQSGGPLNASAEVYPGYTGLVVADGIVRAMTWGFPLAQRSKRTGEPLKPRPVNNARSDKLDSFMWRYSFEERRCLIPMTAWAEAEGQRGAMTRTWLSLPDQPLFAAAGIWRSSDEWGEVYSMVMTDSCGAAAECHDRMPVILHPQDWSRWQGDAPADARALCVPYQGDVSLERTADGWAKRI